MQVVNLPLKGNLFPKSFSLFNLFLKKKNPSNTFFFCFKGDRWLNKLYKIKVYYLKYLFHNVVNILISLILVLICIYYLYSVHYTISFNQALSAACFESILIWIIFYLFVLIMTIKINSRIDRIWTQFFSKLALILIRLLYHSCMHL